MNATDQKEDIRPDPFSISSKSKYGFIYFEKTPHIPIRQWKGWKSIGGEVAERFEDLRDLPIDVIWWTNLLKNEYWQLGKYKKFKCSDFFGVDLDVFMAENNFKNNSPQKTTQIWSEIFSLTLDQLSLIMSEKNINLNFSEGDAADFIKKSFNDQKNVDVAFEKVMEKTYKDKIVNQIPAEHLINKKILTLSKSRYLYLNDIIKSAKFPVGNWIPIGRDKLTDDNEKNKRFIEKNKSYPMLINIDNIQLKSGDKWSLNNSAYLFLGNRFDSRHPQSIWMTREEYDFVKSQANFNIKNILINDKYGNLDSFIFDGITNKQSHFNSSIVKQLLISSYFKAISSQTRDGLTRRKFKITPKEIWLKMIDNFYCFIVADDFQKNGFIISSYGEGEVSIVYDQNKIDLKKLLLLIKKHGMVVPFALTGVDIIPEVNMTDNITDIDNINKLAIFNQWLQYEWSKYNTSDSEVPISLLFDRIAYFYNGDKNLNKSERIRDNLKFLTNFTKQIKDNKYKTLLKELYSKQIVDNVARLKMLE